MRYYSLATYFKRAFGLSSMLPPSAPKVRKIPLDLAGNCPNRDGAKGFGGCIFCDSRGSGTGLGQSGLSLGEQWKLWRARHTENTLFIAYLQSFSNTYFTPLKLKKILYEIAALPGAAGISIGTRPDCIDDEILNLIRSLPFQEIWLELGLQSADDNILRAINRGHDSGTFAAAVHKAASFDLKICAHVMAGLPGETPEGLLKTVDFVSDLPITGIKFHNLYIAKGSDLEKMYLNGHYDPLTQDDYIRVLVQSLPRLRSNIVVHRLVADPPRAEPARPAWAGQKGTLVNLVQAELTAKDLWQGKAKDAPEKIPDWGGK